MYRFDAGAAHASISFNAGRRRWLDREIGIPLWRAALQGSLRGPSRHSSSSTGLGAPHDGCMLVVLRLVGGTDGGGVVVKPLGYESAARSIHRNANQARSLFLGLCLSLNDSVCSTRLATQC